MNSCYLDLSMHNYAMSVYRIPFIIFFFFAASFQTFASAESFNNLEVRLLIIGPGDPVYSYWGHTGLAIKDLNRGTDLFFDFGNFYFKDKDFFKNFAMGRLLYMAYAAYTEPYLKSVIRENRTITEYNLNLSTQAKREMYEALLVKTKPENRTYLYHHYKDNCSTRIRDYLDAAVGGQLKEKSSIPAQTTFRNSFLRFTSGNKLVGTALSLLQGTPIDRDISKWEAMFLPEVMGNYVETFTYRNDAGQEIPLISKKKVLNMAEGRIAVPDTYKKPYGAVLAIALLLSLITLFLKLYSFRISRNAYGVLNIAAGVFLGITGSVLLFLAAFTNHSYSYNNLNLFILNPLELFAIPAAILFIKRGEAWRSRLEMIWLIQSVFTGIMLIIKIFTPIKQDNTLEILLFLPFLIFLSPMFNPLLRKIPDLFVKKGNLSNR